MVYKLAVFPDEHIEIPFSEHVANQHDPESQYFGSSSIAELTIIAFLQSKNLKQEFFHSFMGRIMAS